MKNPDLKAQDCKRFNGYKPCIPFKTCDEECVRPDKPFGTKILIINLDAMGDVLMTTAQLQPLKRKYPESYIAWITLKSVAPLLNGNPFIDDIFLWDAESWLILEQMEFDLILNADKSRRSAALTMKLNAKEKLGFGLNQNGQIVPLNEEASYNYRLGLDDYFKFRMNQRTGQDILAETFKLQYQRDEYVLKLADEEEELTSWYKRSKGISDSNIVVGFNTGCSNLYPNKKMKIEQHLKLIEMFSAKENIKMLLLGGCEDTKRNEEIYSKALERNPELIIKLFTTPTSEGLRKGIVYENASDIVITGDSYGMHLAIALKKYVLVWFGVSCWTEIELYDRGTKLIPAETQDVTSLLFCSPCWKKVCPYHLECIEMIDLEKICSKAIEYSEEIIRAKKDSACQLLPESYEPSTDPAD